MITAERVVGLLLAAGLSRRFGPDDKLVSEHDGRPLVAWPHAAMAAVKFGGRIAVVRTGAPDLAALLGGFTLLENDAPERGMAGSIALSIVAAARLDVDAVLICLGDMPAVDAPLLEALLAAYDPAIGLIACDDGRRRAPPALFGRLHFDALMALEGDAGARDLIAGAPALRVSPAKLHDIDVVLDSRFRGNDN
jgi:molybdenum cofactor cytidylyltransferase